MSAASRRRREGAARPSELAERLGVSKQVMSNQLACLRGCDLVEGGQEGRSTWYRLTDARIGSALGDLLELVVTVDPGCCTPVSMLTAGTPDDTGSGGCDGTCPCCRH